MWLRGYISKHIRLDEFKASYEDRRIAECDPYNIQQVSGPFILLSRLFYRLKGHLYLKTQSAFFNKIGIKDLEKVAKKVKEMEIENINNYYLDGYAYEMSTRVNGVRFIFPKDEYGTQSSCLKCYLREKDPDFRQSSSRNTTITGFKGKLNEWMHNHKMDIVPDPLPDRYYNYYHDSGMYCFHYHYFDNRFDYSNKIAKDCRTTIRNIASRRSGRRVIDLPCPIDLVITKVTQSTVKTLLRTWWCIFYGVEIFDLTSIERKIAHFALRHGVYYIHHSLVWIRWKIKAPEYFRVI